MLIFTFFSIITIFMILQNKSSICVLLLWNFTHIAFTHLFYETYGSFWLFGLSKFTLWSSRYDFFDDTISISFGLISNISCFRKGSISFFLLWRFSIVSFVEWFYEWFKLFWLSRISKFILWILRNGYFLYHFIYSIAIFFDLEYEENGSHLFFCFGNSWHNILRNGTWCSLRHFCFLDFQNWSCGIRDIAWSFKTTTTTTTSGKQNFAWWYSFFWNTVVIFEMMMVLLLLDFPFGNFRYGPLQNSRSCRVYDFFFLDFRFLFCTIKVTAGSYMLNMIHEKPSMYWWWCIFMIVFVLEFCMISCCGVVP